MKVGTPGTPSRASRQAVWPATEPIGEIPAGMAMAVEGEEVVDQGKHGNPQRYLWPP